MVPMATSYPELIFSLIPLALGSTILQSVPTALLSDLTSSSEERAQGQSLLRTCGDVGLVAGAVASGTLLQMTSMQYAVAFDGSVLLSAMAFFSMRHLLRRNKTKNV